MNSYIDLSGALHVLDDGIMGRCRMAGLPILRDAIEMQCGRKYQMPNAKCQKLAVNIMRIHSGC